MRSDSVFKISYWPFIQLDLTAIERWILYARTKKTRKKGRFSRTGDVRAYSGKGIKIAEIWKKG